MEILIEGKQADAWKALSDSTTTEIGYGGAAGGGKSFIGCLWHIDRRIRYPGTRGMIGRSKIRALEESTLVTFFNVCALYGLKADRDYKYNSQKNFIQFSNGSRTVLKDLFHYPADPDFTSLGSTEYTDVFIDEATEIKEKAFDIVKTRIRYKLQEHGLIPKILITCNPQPGWVKKKFIKDDEGKAVTLRKDQIFIHATVDDNPDKQFAANYKSLLGNMTSDYDKARLLYGDWDAKPLIENRFATHFDHEKHVSDRAIFDPKKRIYISLDFNLDPFGFIFEHKWRDASGFHCHQFDEAKIHNGDIDSGIDWIKNKYGKHIHNIVVTGDKMGDKRDFGRRDKASYYQRIRNGLRLKTAQIETPPNPSHENSRSDMAYVMLYFDDYVIHPSCIDTINDLANVEVDAFGKIKKADRSNTNQRADFLDAKRYSINDKFMQAWIRWHQKGNNVPTKKIIQDMKTKDLYELINIKQ